MLIMCLYGLLHCDFQKIHWHQGFPDQHIADQLTKKSTSVSGEENDTTNKFILTAQSDTLTLRTARPPDPPSNLSIAASTCNALRLVWDPPVEHGVEIIGKFFFYKIILKFLILSYPIILNIFQRLYSLMIQCLASDMKYVVFKFFNTVKHQ